MKHLMIIACMLCLSFGVKGQVEMKELLDDIQQNHPLIKAIEKVLEADKKENETDIFLPNPEVEFNYFWGDPGNIGNRTEFNVFQAFDFPTAYAYKKQLSEMKSDQLMLEYEKQRREITFESSQLIVDVVIWNARIKLLKKLVKNAEQLRDAYQEKLKIRAATRLELKKVSLTLMQLKNQLDMTIIKKDASLNQLRFLTGKPDLVFEQSKIDFNALPARFDDWFMTIEETNPTLKWLKAEVELSEKQLQLTKALKLPKMQAGYMSEYAAGETFRGVSMGVSIPLSENRNQLEYSRLKVEAANERKAAQQKIVYNNLKELFERAGGLRIAVQNYSKMLDELDISEDLSISYESGEISLLDYLQEILIILEYDETLIDLQKEYYLVMIELQKYI